MTPPAQSGSTIPRRDPASSNHLAPAEPSPAEADGVDPSSQEVLRAFMRTIHLHRQSMLKLLAAKGAHPGQAIYLRMLARNDGISQRDLAEKLMLAAPTVTSTLQRMERLGMVERRPDPDDQRVTRVHLTAEGRRLEAELHEVFSEYLVRTIDSMPDADRRELARLLGTMADRLTGALHR